MHRAVLGRNLHGYISAKKKTFATVVVRFRKPLIENMDYINL